MANKRDWLGVGDAARQAAVDASTIRRWADNGTVVARRLPGGHRQISQESLDQRLTPITGNPKAVTAVSARQLEVMLAHWTADSEALTSWDRTSVDEATPCEAMMASVESLIRVLSDVRDDLAEQAADIDKGIASWEPASVDKPDRPVRSADLDHLMTMPFPRKSQQDPDTD